MTFPREIFVLPSQTDVALNQTGAVRRKGFRRGDAPTVLIAVGAIVFACAAARTALTWLSVLVISGLCPVDFVNPGTSSVSVTTFTASAGRLFVNTVLLDDRYLATWPALRQTDIAVSPGATRRLVFTCRDGENLGAVVINDGEQLRGGLLPLDRYREFPATFAIPSRESQSTPLPAALEAAYRELGFWTRANLLGYPWPAADAAGGLVAGLGYLWRRIGRARPRDEP